MTVHKMQDGRHALLGSAGSFVSGCLSCGLDIFRVEEPTNELCIRCYGTGHRVEPIYVEDFVAKWLPLWTSKGHTLNYASINGDLKAAGLEPIPVPTT